MQDVGDRPEPSFKASPVYPTTARIAGILWIIFGGLFLLNVLVLLRFMLRVAGGDFAVPGMACGGLIIGLFGGGFIFMGVQTVRGTARDTLDRGIGSIIFSLLNFGWGAVNAGGGELLATIGLRGGGEMLATGIGLLAGVGFLMAGVLALLGRGDYKTWRKAQKARREEGSLSGNENMN